MQRLTSLLTNLAIPTSIPVLRVEPKTSDSDPSLRVETETVDDQKLLSKTKSVIKAVDDQKSITKIINQNSRTKAVDDEKFQNSRTEALDDQNLNFDATVTYENSTGNSGRRRRKASRRSTIASTRKSQESQGKTSEVIVSQTATTPRIHNHGTRANSLQPRALVSNIATVCNKTYDRRKRRDAVLIQIKCSF